MIRNIVPLLPPLPSDWSAMLAAEEARAMAGKPAFRVRMAAKSGIACPRCQRPMGVRCGRNTSNEPSCRERVWAMRALQRSPAMSRPPKVADVAPFLDIVTKTALDYGIHPHGDGWIIGAEMMRDDVLNVAIRHGLVALRVSEYGGPVWVITEAGAEYAAGWKGRGA